MGYYADVQRHVRRGKCDTVKLVDGILRRWSRDMYDVVNVTRLNWSMGYQPSPSLMITGRDMYDVVNVTRLNWSLGYQPSPSLMIAGRDMYDVVNVTRLNWSLGYQPPPSLMITGKRHVRRGKCDTVKLVNGILAFLLMIPDRDMYDVVNVTRLNWSMGYQPSS